MLDPGLYSFNGPYVQKGGSKLQSLQPVAMNSVGAKQELWVFP